MNSTDSPNSTSDYGDTSLDDARLYSLLHEMDGEPVSRSERRDGERGDYICQQLVAPYSGGPLPDQAEFRHVECRDLSTTGFSFMSDAVPDTDRLVIALGRVPFRFFIAQVVNHKPEMAGGKPSYRIGCRFCQRVK